MKEVKRDEKMAEFKAQAFVTLMAAGQTEAAESMFDDDKDEEIDPVNSEDVEWVVPRSPEELSALLADIGAFGVPIST